MEVNLKRYANEAIVIVSIVFLVGAIIYRHGAVNSLHESRAEFDMASKEIKETISLRKLWSSKGLRRKIKSLGATVSPSSVKSMVIDRNKAKIVLTGLSGRELNSFLGKLAGMPVVFRRLDIRLEGEKYRMECICGW